MDDTTVYAEPEKETKKDQSFGDEAMKPGQLLTLKDEELAKLCVRMWESQNTILSRVEAQWDVNEKRRAGIKNVQLRMEGDDLSWRAWTPPSSEQSPDVIHAMNKAATLCRKLSAIMFADAPAPLPEPDSGEDEDRDAAEFSERILLDLQKPTRLNTIRNARLAFDKGSTFGSGFIYYCMDPYGGGRMKLQVDAGYDPETKQGATKYEEASRQPDGRPWPYYREMFVKEDGTLIEEPKEAAERNVPALCEELLTGRNVRFLPHTDDIFAASGVMIAAFVPWGKVRKQFPELSKLDDSERKELFTFKPKRALFLLAPEERRVLKQEQDNPDEQRVFVQTIYYKSCPDYQRGAYVTVVGGKKPVVQEEWCFEDDNGLTIPLPLPLTQYGQFSEGTDNPYRHGTMEIVGPGNEIRANLIGDLLDSIDRQINRKVFVPLTSILRPEDLRQQGNTTVPINPGGEPHYEEVPSFPADGMNLFQITTKEMEADATLGDVAQGLESPQVQSGRHAQAITAQVHAALSDLRSNIELGYLRACHIQLMMVRAYYDTPQRIGWVGEDGAYKERRWTGADLRSTGDVSLKPGSLTMLSPISKSQLAVQFAQFGFVHQDDLRDMLSSNLGGMLGLRDDPFVTRIRRQIAQWLEGPPEGWQPQMQQVPAVDPAGQPMVDPSTGQPQLQPQQVIDPVLQGIFRPYPVDDLPNVALVRLRELSKTMSKTEFAIQPIEWQFGLLQEFGRASTGAAGAMGGQQPGQDPGAPSPAQRTQGPMAQAKTPLPEETSQQDKNLGISRSAA